MERLFGSLPEALEATQRIAAGCDFQLPLAGAAARYGPRLFFGSGKDEEALAERLSQLARDGLARRYRDRIPEGALARLEDELRLITQRPELVDALLLAVEVRDFASEQHILLQARGSATMSLVCSGAGQPESVRARPGPPRLCLRGPAELARHRPGDAGPRPAGPAGVRAVARRRISQRPS